MRALLLQIVTKNVENMLLNILARRSSGSATCDARTIQIQLLFLARIRGRTSRHRKEKNPAHRMHETGEHEETKGRRNEAQSKLQPRAPKASERPSAASAASRKKKLGRLKVEGWRFEVLNVFGFFFFVFFFFFFSLALFFHYGRPALVALRIFLSFSLVFVETVAWLRESFFFLFFVLVPASHSLFFLISF